jgi:hypothetical protein
MHPLIKLIRTPRIIQNEQRGDDDQREGWRELANHPTNNPSYGEGYPFEDFLHFFANFAKTFYY